MSSSAKKPKIKIVTKKPDPSDCELAKPSLTRDGQGAPAYVSKATELGVLKKCSAHTAGDGKEVQSVCGTKRGPEEMVDRYSRKRIKMDRIMVCKCSVILKKLMKHQYGLAFNQPVDPVALNIPDYFSIISKPMDLGTIRSKLEKNLYATADEFEADIRLTFSNAKQYNPPGNLYHKMAQELDSLFSAQWRFVGPIMERENIKGEADKGLSDVDKKLHNVKGGCQRMSSHHTKASPRRSTLLTEEMNVNCSKQESSRKVPAKDIRILEEEKNQIHKTESKLLVTSAVSPGARSSVRVENVYSSSTHADVLDGKPTGFTKQTETKKMFVPASKLSGSNAVSPGAKRSVQVENVCPRFTHADVLHGKSTESTKNTEPKKMNGASIGKKVPLGSARTSNVKTSSNDLRTCEKSVDELAIKCRPSGICGSYPDFVDWRSPSCETQLSPAKASRAEMLKRRFADTILKAQHQTLLHSGDQAHQVKMEIDKQRLGRRQHEEKQKTEAEVKASRDRQESERKIQRQREREAARIALEKMEKSVEFEDNMSILKDLASMTGDSSFAGPLRGYSGMYVAAKQFVNGKLKSPLERLGLFLKEDDEYMFGDDHGHDRDLLLEDLEEGELIY